MTVRHRLDQQAQMPPHDAVEIPGLHRKDERGLPLWLVVAIVILGLLAVAGGVYATLGAGDAEDQRDINAVQRDAAIDSALNLGREVTAACAQGKVVQDDQGRDLCATAAQVQSDPVPGVAVQGERGPGPTVEQIRAVVAEYMATHPPPRGEAGRAPTPDEVAAAVAQHLTANPPRPGRPPTAGEITNAVATYFATNPPPPGARGQDGSTGMPGRPPTAEEIQAAVSSYLAQNPPPQGIPGPEGPAGPACQPGTSLDTVQFGDGRFGLACVFDDQPDPEPTDDPDPTTEPTAETPPTTTTDPPDDVESEPGP
jgi:hypothetical protein